MKKLAFLLAFLLSISLIFSSFSNAMIHSAAPTASDLESESLPVSNTLQKSILDRVVFFGDSTTYGLFRYNIDNNGEHGSNYHTLKPSQIWVPKDGTFYLGNLFSSRIALSDGRCLSLAEACTEKKPPILIITVGINGLRSWNEETFSKYYEKMLDIISESSPNTKIVLQSVYPTAEKRSDELADFSCDKIDKLNGWILTIAQKRGLTYLNTASALKDSLGNLREDFQNGDGLHLNTKGFNAVLAYIENNLHL